MSAISMNADAEALVTISALVMPPNYHQERLTMKRNVVVWYTVTR
jgi:hypothetical protein